MAQRRQGLLGAGKGSEGTQSQDKAIRNWQKAEAKRKQYQEDPEAKKRILDQNYAWRAKTQKEWRDIGDFPMQIDWKRRLSCKNDLKLFCRTYLPEIFFMSWSKDQNVLVERTQAIVSEGGKFTVAMPRGGGKTATIRGGTLWGALYNHRRFIYNIASKEEGGHATLRMVIVHIENNPLIRQDFPEICWAFSKLERSNHLAKRQTYKGESTHINRADDDIIFPYLLLPQNVADHYLENDPTSVKFVPHLQQYVNSNGGVILRSAGIDGSIRGEAEADPIWLTQPRPDLAILDDVQKDQKADSPLLCEKLIRLIDGAVTGLAGSGQHIDVLMPCTVIREGDVADTYLNPLLKPEFQGFRCKMVVQWPAGITDYEISNETQEGKFWTEYAEIRRNSLRDVKNISQATAFYVKHRKIMDKGFVVSWAERYEKRPGGNQEASAQQHAMNLRLQNQELFLSEYQNIGRRLIAAADVLITSDQLAAKQCDLKRGELAAEHQFLVCHIDVQDEILFYSTFSCDQDFNGVFVDYGTWPDTKHSYFTKAQTASWGMITSMFFQEYPKYKGKAFRNSAGKVRAPLEPKIYWALQKATTELLGRQYTKKDAFNSKRSISLLTIDARWGQASEVIKRFIRETGDDRIRPYFGHAFPPTNRQLEEYERRPGWFFEDMLHPNVREPKWVWRPNPGNGEIHLQADVNRLKDFLFARLATPMGAPGCVSLHRAPVEYHELVANHVCTSEYPEPISARGITKNQWTVREGTGYDNDFLDCFSACMAGASALGASIKTSTEDFRPKSRSLASLHASKRTGKTEKVAGPRLRLSSRGTH